MRLEKGGAKEVCAVHDVMAHAGQGSEEHVRRQRVLALTGWSAEVLAPEHAQRAHGDTVDTTTAVLRCAMCDARAGLWNFVPGMAVVGRMGLAHAAGLHRRSCLAWFKGIARACFTLAWSMHPALLPECIIDSPHLPAAILPVVCIWHAIMLDQREWSFAVAHNMMAAET